MSFTTGLEIHEQVPLKKSKLNRNGNSSATRLASLEDELEGVGYHAPLFAHSLSALQEHYKRLFMYNAMKHSNTMEATSRAIASTLNRHNEDSKNKQELASRLKKRIANKDKPNDTSMSTAILIHAHQMVHNARKELEEATILYLKKRKGIQAERLSLPVNELMKNVHWALQSGQEKVVLDMGPAMYHAASNVEFALKYLNDLNQFLARAEHSESQWSSDVSEETEKEDNSNEASMDYKLLTLQKERTSVEALQSLGTPPTTPTGMPTPPVTPTFTPNPPFAPFRDNTTSMPSSTPSSPFSSSTPASPLASQSPPILLAPLTVSPRNASGFPRNPFPPLSAPLPMNSNTAFPTPILPSIKEKLGEQLMQIQELHRNMEENQRIEKNETPA